MKNLTNDKTLSPSVSAKLSLSKETIKGLTVRAGVKAGLRLAAGSSDNGAGGSCTYVIA